MRAAVLTAFALMAPLTSCDRIPIHEDYVAQLPHPYKLTEMERQQVTHDLLEFVNSKSYLDDSALKAPVRTLEVRASVNDNGLVSVCGIANRMHFFRGYLHRQEKKQSFHVEKVRNFTFPTVGYRVDLATLCPETGAV